MKPDLHIHSAYSSDGEIGVKEIVDKCIQSGLTVFSLTDHNSIGGISEAIKYSKNEKLHFIPGIEIDCRYKGTDLHLLGYNIDWESPDFETLENDVRDKLMASFSEMIDNLSKAGITVRESDVIQAANGKLPSGELIAEVLLSNPAYAGNELLLPYRPGGERSDMPYLNFYLDYFSQGKPAYVKIKFMEYIDALSLVKDNKGIPIVAHPGLNFKGREEVVKELLDAGARGVEIFNNYHDENQMHFFAEMVMPRNLLMTSGSDFHGKNKPVIEIGHYRSVDQYERYMDDSIERLVN